MQYFSHISAKNVGSELYFIHFIHIFYLSR